jgi:hypothetical protein
MRWIATTCAPVEPRRRTGQARAALLVGAGAAVALGAPAARQPIVTSAAADAELR